MKKLIIKLLSTTLLITLLSITSCTYEDGPRISLRSKTARLTGKWIQESPSLGEGAVAYMEFKEDNQAVTGGNYTVAGTVVPYSSNATWQWEDGKERVRITWGPVDDVIITIKRLTNSELWYVYEGDDEVYMCEKE